VLETADAPPSDVLSINIGTTHFINAVVQADAEKLCPVAVLRLCGPFCREVPPFADFPRQLRAVVEGYTGYLSGGLERKCARDLSVRSQWTDLVLLPVDGRRIAEVNEEEVIEHAQRIKESGIQAVVVIGVFSSVDTADATQEEHVKRLLETYVPGVDVVCSRDIGGVGFIERENASILNASMLEFGRKTIHSFEMAIAALGIDCPVYLTQNDGTVIDMHMAARTPIKTFSSGATVTSPVPLSEGIMAMTDILNRTLSVVLCSCHGCIKPVLELTSRPLKSSWYAPPSRWPAKKNVHLSL